MLVTPLINSVPINGKMKCRVIETFDPFCGDRKFKISKRETNSNEENTNDQNPKVSRKDAKTLSYLKLSFIISFASFAALREKKSFQ